MSVLSDDALLHAAIKHYTKVFPRFVSISLRVFLVWDLVAQDACET